MKLARVVSVVSVLLSAFALASACTDDAENGPGLSLEAGALDAQGQESADGSAAPDVNTPSPSADAGPDTTTSTSDAASLDGGDGAATDATGVSDAPSDAPSDGAADASDGAASIGALHFDGVNDRVYLPTTPDAGAANETAFTVELWFRTTALTGTFFEVYGKTGGADRFIYLEAGKPCFYVYGSPTTEMCGATAGFNDGQWHHIAGTLGATGGMRLYVDGALAGSAATPNKSTFTWDTDFVLGYGHIGFLSGLVSFAGDLDEVRLWSVERTGAEIAANYNKAVAANSAGLQGYWKLDESGSTATAQDQTAGAHHGTLTNFTFVTSPWVGGAL